ncbi:hypothetical protein [Sporosarcina sp. SAFN-015]|uniref:hypothetical protein n=1 Tax=Sporosarcina sp. SAFN-015 TaxID=3387274 RepID=UPI003F7DEC6C
MDNRSFKAKSLDAVNSWTFAEMGEKKAKKEHKADIKRRRRTLEKRHAEKEVDDGIRETDAQ